MPCILLDRYCVLQGSVIFWTSGPHSVLTRFQRAATIPADQKRKIFARNSGLFSAELMAKTKKKKKKGLRQKFKPFFGRIDGEDRKKIFARNAVLFSDELVAKTTQKRFRYEMRIISKVYCCISIIEKKRSRAGWQQKVAGKMLWRAASGPRTVDCRPLVYSTATNESPTSVSLFTSEDRLWAHQC